ncbi:MAG: hypothetical protein JO233_07965 [Candidatus Eremiobacteraeota bacterium]|nr:hypothetical protein [Candidatus Eremiobacteraeota bacterium]
MSKRRKTMYQPRSVRARRQALIRAGVWVFLVLFVFSIVGVAIAVVSTTANR